MPRIACMWLWPPIAEQPLPGASPSSSTPMSSSIFIVRSTAGAGRCRTGRVLHWLGVTRIHRFESSASASEFTAAAAVHGPRCRHFLRPRCREDRNRLRYRQLPRKFGELIVPRCDGAIDLEVAEHDTDRIMATGLESHAHGAPKPTGTTESERLL